MNLLCTAARMGLGALFLLSALLKLLAADSFELYLFSFGFLSFDGCSWAARLLIAAEGVLGAALATGCHYRRVRWVTAGVLVLFSLWLAGLLLTGHTGNCHCFGELVSLDAGASLLKNGLLALLLAIAWPAERPRWLLPSRWQAATAALLVLLPFVVSPPDGLLRPHRAAAELLPERFAPVADSLRLTEGRRMVCLYSVGCRHCRQVARRLAYLFRRHAIPAERMTVIFMETEPDMEGAAARFFAEQSDSTFFPPFATLDARTLLRMCRGALPTLFLTDEGRVVAAYDPVTLDEGAVASFFNGL